ncbi:MAG: hypothetical protein ABI340_02705 [Nitrososphaera sp.]|jgi:hypothetical protein
MKTIRLFLVPIVGSMILLIPYLGVLLYAIILYRWYNGNQKNIHAYFTSQELQPVGNVEYNREQFGFLKNGESLEDLK